MTRRTLFSTLLCLLIVSVVMQTSPSHPSTIYASTSMPITRIVIFDKENHTFDNLFGTFPGANGATTYTDNNGVVHSLAHAADSLPHDICHTYLCAKAAENNGAMNGFSITGESQYYQSDIPNYWSYAQHFSLADNAFYEVESNSFSNHIASIAGTDMNVDELPVTPGGGATNLWGCDAGKGTTVETRTATNVVNNVYPCFDEQTLGDEVSAAGLTWKYYAPSIGTKGYQWSTYDSVKHIRDTSQWATHVVDYSNFITDASTGNLPSVSWLTDPMAVSDHPPNSLCAGENESVQEINAVMNGPDWAHTAILLTWDDWGGFYDHVAPTHTGQSNPVIETGFRVPMILISPYSIPGDISHTYYTGASMVKFAESIFGLPALTQQDAQANTMLDMLNFNQTPLAPLPLSTRTCPAAKTTAVVTDVG